MRLKALLISVLLLGAGPLHAENLRALSDSLNHHPPELIYKIDLSNDSVSLVYGTIYFTQGILYLSADDSSYSASAFYTGEGKFIYRPSDKVEEQQVNRFYKSDSALVRFDRIYFAFPGESDLMSLFSDKAVKGGPDSRANIEYNQIIKIPPTVMNYNLQMDIYKASIEGKDDFLWADMAEQNQHSIYIYNPYEREPVSLYLYSARFSSPQLVSSTENDGHCGIVSPRVRLVSI